MRKKTVVKLGWWLPAILLLVGKTVASVPLERIAVQTWATWSESPPEIVLHWIADTNAVSYSIYRKLRNENSWTPLASFLPGTDTSWTDRNVQVGVAYEYQIQKKTDIPQTGYGYLYAGIRVPLVESRGKVILVVESSLAGPLAFNLAQYQRDLIGDGWTVIRHDVDATAPVTEVKELIKADYLADPADTKALILFGHVPVPYSGYIAPDGHDDHRGAWPADVYYGEFDGQWTDTSVTATSVANPKNRNIPGDGKFDQAYPPGEVRLQIGRIDLSNLTSFANKIPSRNEIDLSRQYLIKDHAFRHGLLNVPRRALLYTREAGAEDEPQIATAYRNFRSFFGDELRTIVRNQFLPTLNAEAYLWSYIVSAGDITQCYDIATADNLAVNDPKTVFTSFMGSYFGDWDRESAFLRSVLGTTTHTLTTFYGGQPQWILHPLALGETIGACAQLTQNNGPNGLYAPHLNFGVGEVHIALLGDPTIRMHPVAPPSSLTAEPERNGLRLQWNPSPDAAVLGYNIYKSSIATGPFTRLNTSEPVADPSFVDPAGSSNDFYMVRAVKLEETPAGSYYNASQGIFFPGSSSQSASLNLTNLNLSEIQIGSVKIAWEEKSGTAEYFQIERRTGSESFQPIASIPGVERGFIDSTVVADVFTYRVTAFGYNGSSMPSNELEVDLRQPNLSLVRVDEHGGNWIGRYGQDGYIIYDAETNLPPYINKVSEPYALRDVADWDAEDDGALMRPTGLSRIYAFRFVDRGALKFQFLCNDSRAHRVAIYVVDPADVRSGRAELVDPFRGVVVESKSFGHFPTGKYLVFDIQRYATIRIASETNNANAVISGIFFMPAILEPPVISPPTGGFPGKTKVSISSSLGGTIRFTTDGTDPTESSPIYMAPFPNSQTLTIKARVFKDGYDPSAISSVSITNDLFSSAAFVGSDTATQGDWQKSFGQDAYKISNGAAKNSDSLEFAISKATEYLWSDSTTELRALRKNPESTARVASCWYSATEFQLDTTLYVEQPATVALYFLDWDRVGRVQEVIVTDPAGVELDRRRVENFGDGKYLVWNVRGAVRFTIKKITGPNAILNGVFIGESAPPVSPAPSPVRLATVLLSNGAQYQIRLQGQPGQIIDIESTTDFRVWTLFRRVTFSGTTMDWTFAVPSTPGMRFYRATAIP